MKRITTKQSAILLSSVFLFCLFIKCTNEAATPAADSGLSPQQMLERGKYLVTIGVCNDCHSPKIFNPDGSFKADESKPLSGHPAESTLPPIDTTEITPGKWVMGSSDLTAWVGPWGISYAANLTPDSITGLGAWTEEVFISTLRTGKHLGQAQGRPILPPMPWDYISQMTDQDLKSVFAYLKSLKPISNQVPAPVAPPGLAAMVSAAK